jgi:hypothetical protein
MVRTDELSRPSRRAIFRIASPPRHRSHTSAFSNSVNRTTNLLNEKPQLSPNGVAFTP